MSREKLVETQSLQNKIGIKPQFAVGLFLSLDY